MPLATNRRGHASVWSATRLPSATLDRCYEPLTTSRQRSLTTASISLSLLRSGGRMPRSKWRTSRYPTGSNHNPPEARRPMPSYTTRQGAPTIASRGSRPFLSSRIQRFSDSAAPYPRLPSAPTHISHLTWRLSFLAAFRFPAEYPRQPLSPRAPLGVLARVPFPAPL